MHYVEGLMMRLNSIELANFFQEKGVQHYYHANTLKTSLSFIHAGGLLSRGDVERMELQQTPQRSDRKDREVDVWDDQYHVGDFARLDSELSIHVPVLTYYRG